MRSLSDLGMATETGALVQKPPGPVHGGLSVRAGDAASIVDELDNL